MGDTATTSGPYRSTHPEFAAAVRARHRQEVDALKVGEALEVSVPEDIAFAEEGPSDDDDPELKFTEDGILIEPFNLRAERDEGYFDGEGNYIAFKRNDDTDAWLETLQGDDDVVRGEGLQISRTRGDEDNVENKPEMSNSDRKAFRQRIVGNLESGECVLEALKRLSAGRSTHEISTSQTSKADKIAALRVRLAGTVPQQNRSAFDSLTSDAGHLLNAGDTNIYIKSKEILIADLRRAEVQEKSATQMTLPSRSMNDSSNSNRTNEPYPQASRLPPGNAMDLDESSHSPDQDHANESNPIDASEPPTPSKRDEGDTLSNRQKETPRKRQRVTFALPEEGSKREQDGLHTDHEMSNQDFDMKGFEYNESSGMYYNTDLGCYYDVDKRLYKDAASGRWYEFVNGRYQLANG